MDLIKVLLVIDVRLIGNIFASVLDEEADIKVVGCVTTLQDAIEFIQSKEVHVILVSAGLPDHGALEITRMIMDRGCRTKVLALGLSEENQNEAIRYIEAGACGYVLKDSSVHELIEAIRLAQKGEAQVSGRIAMALMERLVHFARMFSAVENKIEGDVRLTSR
jgi:DNA-binding NarL/FixJ family response regulator